jgi:hypothetical protein
MTNQEKKATTPLSAEDRTRAIRLQEEIVGRLEELSLITARTLGQSASAPASFTFTRVFNGSSNRPNEAELAVARQAAEDYILIKICDGSTCGCYEDPPGICYPC